MNEYESGWLWFWLFSPTNLLCSGEKCEFRPPCRCFAHPKIVCMFSFSAWALQLNVPQHLCCMNMDDITTMSEGLTIEFVFSLIANENGETHYKMVVYKQYSMQTRKKPLKWKMCVGFLFQLFTQIWIWFLTYTDLVIPSWCLSSFSIFEITSISFARHLHRARQFHPLNKCCIFIYFFFSFETRFLPLWTQRNVSTFVVDCNVGWTGLNRCSVSKNFVFRLVDRRRMTYLFIGFFVNCAHINRYMRIPKCIITIIY